MWCCIYTAGGSCQSQTLWRNKQPDVTSDSALIQSHLPTEGQLRDQFWMSGIKRGSIFTPVYERDRSSDPQRWASLSMFMFCNLNCWLELEGKRTLLYDSYVTERTGNDRPGPVMDLNSNTRTDTALVQMLLQSLCTVKLHIISFSAIMVGITVRRFNTTNKAFLYNGVSHSEVQHWLVISASASEVKFFHTEQSNPILYWPGLILLKKKKMIYLIWNYWLEKINY